MLRNIMLYTCMVIITLVIMLLLGELVVRIFAPQAMLPRFVESAPYGIRKVIGNVEARHETSEYRYLYTTNSMGFRGQKEYSLRKNDDVFRIVVQGDSVTLGHGVPDNETFAYLLGEKLNEPVRKSEVINMGVSGFGTAEEIIQYENVAQQYSPDLVVLGYFQNDDLNNHVSKLYSYNNGQLERESSEFQPGLYLRDRLYKIPFYSFLAQSSHLFTFARTRASALILKNLEEESYAPTRQTQAKSDTSLEEIKLASDLTRELLNEYANIVTSSGAKLIIISIVDKRFKTDFPFDLDFGDDVFVIGTKEKFSEFAENGYNLFYELDAHPTAEGHALIAELIHQLIRDEELTDIAIH